MDNYNYSSVVENQNLSFGQDDLLSGELSTGELSNFESNAAADSTQATTISQSSTIESNTSDDSSPNSDQTTTTSQFNSNVSDSNQTDTTSQSSTIESNTSDGSSTNSEISLDSSSNNFSVAKTFEGGSGKNTYQFEIGRSGKYDFNLANLSANLDLSVSDRQGNTLYSSAQPDAQAELISAELQPGSYSVDVTGAESVFTDYELSITGAASNESPPESPSDDGKSSTPEGETVYKFFRTDGKTDFYTTDEVERDYILENSPQYEYKGESFVSAPIPESDDLTGLAPVYRFLNTDTGAHLYTASAAEKDYVTGNIPSYTPEGIAYYSYESQQEGTIPLYRLYNQSSNAHFYTPSSEERDSYLDSPDYRLEGNADGIAFFVKPVDTVI